jgi:hypothetical protein
MDDALAKEHPGLVDNLSYGVEHVVAYAEHPDSIKRVLEAFRRDNLTPFIETLNLRLAAPARVCFQMGRSVEPFTFVFDVFESLVADLDAYLDAESIRRAPGLIAPREDARAIDAYARLVEGWALEEEAAKRVARLTKALSAHRQ